MMTHITLRRIALAGASLFALAGCTSIQYSDYSEAVRVTSKRPGAEIRAQGKLLGVTPAIVRIPRQMRPALTLGYAGGVQQTHKLDSRYRIFESLAPALFLGPVAPVAVLVDLWTGTAWDISDLKDVEVQGEVPAGIVTKPRRVAIAPPSAPSQIDSDRLGEFLGENFKSEDGATVLPFRQTLGDFEDSQVTFESSPKASLRNELYADLGVTHIVESKADVPAGKFRYQVRDVLNDRVESEGELPLTTLNHGGWSRARYFFSGLIPNTVSLDASNTWITAKIGGTENALVSRAEPIAGWMGEASRFFGSIGFSNLVPPRSRADFAGRFRLVSTASLAVSEFQFPTDAGNFENTEFRRYRGIIAFGPEVYLETKMGYFYAHLLGGGGYSRIEWHSPARTGELDRATLNSVLGFGFYGYVSSRVSVRVFYRIISEDRRNWDLAFERSQGVAFPTNSVASVNGGVALGFYLPEVRRSLRR